MNTLEIRIELRWEWDWVIRSDCWFESTPSSLESWNGQFLLVAEEKTSNDLGKQTEFSLVEINKTQDIRHIPTNLMEYQEEWEELVKNWLMKKDWEVANEELILELEDYLRAVYWKYRNSINS